MGGVVVSADLSTVGFGANAVQGVGGQGEFLRAMMHVMERWQQATVYARAAHSDVVSCVNLPFQQGWRRRAFDAVLAVPVLLVLIAALWITGGGKLSGESRRSIEHSIEAK